MKLTERSPKSKSKVGWPGNASNASNVSVDMRTSIACFGPDDDVSVGRATDIVRAVFVGNGMMGVMKKEGYRQLQPCNCSEVAVQ